MPWVAVIDPDKLPKRAVVDSGVLIRALGQRADDPKAAACRDFWTAMLKAKRDLLITTLTVAEVTRHAKKYTPVQIPSVPNVLVVTFDPQAAKFLAEKLPEEVVRNEVRNGLFVEYLHYDSLILACAGRHDAVLVTLDEPLHRLAVTAGIECHTVQFYEGAATQQTSLLDRLDRG